MNGYALKTACAVYCTCAVALATKTLQNPRSSTWPSEVAYYTIHLSSLNTTSPFETFQVQKHSAMRYLVSLLICGLDHTTDDWWFEDYDSFESIFLSGDEAVMNLVALCCVAALLITAFIIPSPTDREETHFEYLLNDGAEPHFLEESEDDFYLNSEDYSDLESEDDFELEIEDDMPYLPDPVTSIRATYIPSTSASSVGPRTMATQTAEPMDIYFFISEALAPETMCFIPEPVQVRLCNLFLGILVFDRLAYLSF